MRRLVADGVTSATGMVSDSAATGAGWSDEPLPADVAAGPGAALRSAACEPTSALSGRDAVAGSSSALLPPCWRKPTASATAIAPTAAEADALATAFFIQGVEATEAYCVAHPGVGAILLPEGDDARPVVVGIGRDAIELGKD